MALLSSPVSLLLSALMHLRLPVASPARRPLQTQTAGLPFRPTSLSMLAWARFGACT